MSMKSGYSHILNVSCAEKMEKNGRHLYNWENVRPGQEGEWGGNKGVETILIFPVVAGVHTHSLHTLLCYHIAMDPTDPGC